MSAQEQARELMAKQRHHDEHLQESISGRAQAEVNKPKAYKAVTQEQAPELMTQQRHHDEHLQESMLNRAEVEEAADSSQEQS